MNKFTYSKLVQKYLVFFSFSFSFKIIETENKTITCVFKNII